MDTNKENVEIQNDNPWNGVSTLCESKSISQTDGNKEKTEVRKHSQSSRDNAIEEDLLPGKGMTLLKRCTVTQRIFFYCYLSENRYKHRRNTNLKKYEYDKHETILLAGTRSKKRSKI